MNDKRGILNPGPLSSAPKMRRSLPRTRCSVLRATGNLCGRLVMKDAPFPICEDHAHQLYAHMLAAFPPPKPEQSVEFKRWLMVQEKREEWAAQDAARKQAFERQSQVYYVRIGDHVKIGFTTNMYQRLIALRVDANNVLATEPGGRRLEAQRHTEFAAERIGRKENFNPSPRLLAHIEAVRAEHGDPRITNYKTARNHLGPLTLTLSFHHAAGRATTCRTTAAHTTPRATPARESGWAPSPGGQTRNPEPPAAAAIHGARDTAAVQGRQRMTIMATRPRSVVLFDLFKVTREAKRMMYVDPGYAGKHDEINALLDELEALGFVC